MKDLVKFFTIHSSNRLYRKDDSSRFLKDLFIILTAPVIYLQIIPALLLDVFVTIYQKICFPIYDIPPVDRSKYISFDRHKLNFLSPIKKINCLYCKYFNGVMSYVREVAARTEVFWCPLKNKFRESPHQYYNNFADRGEPREFDIRYNNFKEGPE